MENLDKKTFPELWGLLSDVQRADVRLKLLSKKCTTTPQTIYNWADGRTKPVSALVQDTIANVVGQYLGVKLYGRVLFPPKPLR